MVVPHDTLERPAAIAAFCELATCTPGQHISEDVQGAFGKVGKTEAIRVRAERCLMCRRLPKADVHWLSQQLTAVVESLMPTSEECARQAAAFDKVTH